MCQQHQQDEPRKDHHNSSQNGHNQHDKSPSRPPFPWHLPVHDAHCHPTDTMPSLETSLPTMKARTLTIMATRFQDQHLVAQVAASHGVKSRDELRRGTAEGENGKQDVKEGDEERGACRVIPSFGFHPWFSHLFYDDSAAEPTFDPSKFTSQGHDEQTATTLAKQAHYDSVLTPPPTPTSSTSSSSSSSPSDFVSSLPNPTPFSQLLSSTRTRLQTHPLALVGEIGIDKAFRLPESWSPENSNNSTHSSDRRDADLTPGGREGRRLSPYRVELQHQVVVMKAQLKLAGEQGRAVSVHGVQAHGVLLDAVRGCWKGWEREVVSRRQRRMVAPGAEDSESESEPDDVEDNSNGNDQGQRKSKSKPFPPRICLHSYSGAPELVRQWLHPSSPSTVFFSFSPAVNLSPNKTNNSSNSDSGSSHYYSLPPKVRDVIAALPEDRVLVESDLHTAADGAMDGALEEMVRVVCEIKGWELEDGVERLARNYEAFVFGKRKRRGEESVR